MNERRLAISGMFWYKNLFSLGAPSLEWYMNTMSFVHLREAVKRLGVSVAGVPNVFYGAMAQVAMDVSNDE